MERADELCEIQYGGPHPVCTMEESHKCAYHRERWHQIECFVLLRMEFDSVFIDDSAAELDFSCNKLTLLGCSCWVLIHVAGVTVIGGKAQLAVSFNLLSPGCLPLLAYFVRALSLSRATEMMVEIKRYKCHAIY